MATNYSLQIRVPVTTTYNRWHHYENHCDSEVVYGNSTWDNLLLNIKAYYESTYGGQFLYTYTSSVSHYVLNIDYNNLSTDPVGTYCGDIVAIGIKHGNDWHFGAWVEGGSVGDDDERVCGVGEAAGGYRRLARRYFGCGSCRY